MAKKDELAFEGGVESPQPNKQRKTESTSRLQWIR